MATGSLFHLWHSGANNSCVRTSVLQSFNEIITIVTFILARFNATVAQNPAFLRSKNSLAFLVYLAIIISYMCDAVSI
jgi:hypothetical protein